MSNRQDKEREALLQPERMDYAVKELHKLGYTTIRDDTKIIFKHKGQQVLFYPYSGWHTGKTIKDGRGLKNLLNQLKTK